MGPSESEIIPSLLTQPLGCLDGQKKLLSGRAWGFQPPSAPSQLGSGRHITPLIQHSSSLLSFLSPTPHFILVYKELL